MSELVKIEIEKESLNDFLNHLKYLGDGIKLKNVPKELQTKDFCISYFDQNFNKKSDIQEIVDINPEFLKERKFLLELIKSNPRILTLMTDYDEEFSLQAVMSNKYMAGYIPEKHLIARLDTFIKLCPDYIAEHHERLFKDIENKDEYYYKLINKSPDTMGFLPSNIVIDIINTTDSLLLVPYMYGVISETIRDQISEDIVKKLLAKDGMLLRFVKNPSEEMIQIAIEQDPAAQLYLSNKEGL